MNKMLSVSLLALGVMCTMPAAAAPGAGLDPQDYVKQGIPGGLYIQDPSKGVQILYNSNSSSVYTTQLYIATLDVDGNFVDDWALLFRSVGTNGTKGTIVGCSDCLMSTDNTLYTYDFSQGAAEVVFKWVNEKTGIEYFSIGIGGQPFYGAYNLYGESVAFFGNGAVIGFEDYAHGKYENYGQWDWNDILINVYNIGNTKQNIPLPLPPNAMAVPEPETYAMLLAGFGMIGFVTRRRKP
ncbi:MAG: PEPxxWA-CTERM sorting domain-containing protein [Betaproteobacteria bacterium]|nr:PEPxxWA-CTERM sorting domain-containing protein [Betaproteobacteria bacterium]